MTTRCRWNSNLPSRTNSTLSSTWSVGRRVGISQKILKPAGNFITAVGSTEHGGKITIGTVAGMVGGSIWKGVTSSRNDKFISGLPIGEVKQLEQSTAIPAVTMSLADAGKAHELSATHRTVGKIVLLP
ncbi:hypothetical protein HDU97_002792 [Phlyctochytrium planicorne]|nr:hypothetical protein HDU97_002792 [Phlyctochytrium planicorne]